MEAVDSGCDDTGQESYGVLIALPLKESTVDIVDLSDDGGAGNDCL